MNLRCGVGARMPRFGLVDAALEAQLAGDGRHHGFIAVAADSHFDLVAEIDAVDEFEEAVDEVLAGLLAVADDVDAGIFLHLDRKQGRVELAGFEIGAGQPPLRPQFIRLREP